MNPKISTLVFFMCLYANILFAQKTISAAPDQLYKDIVKADSLLFNAFNHCDSLTYRKFINNDIEFYHDLGGLNVGADYEMRSIMEMCARGNQIRRELVKSTLEVHPIQGYGAVEIGVHTFYHTNKGQTQEKVSGTYKFVQLWQFKDGAWKLARVISYGHNEMHND
ncbi:nuclear transport factor 2 family protein [Dyadobacter chenwenxiniae]|uniref:Nuclear transport factor 2 family protein n=1 Tax=Dyadobacter chenwenxiniae TaxID=2906456 RepID=A0A9X1PQM6_9BACT|nr:nuclear transport factor 2 family protein [Dyadobacter chenwenxiniae]MCF0065642.1 nuclear transport factor 2 family protein [Dyadobacter chenwenxiniae]UON85553.1 nuclear transport factor 2 family protein [Dyadobacter chenwenxiniae]